MDKANQPKITVDSSALECLPMASTCGDACCPAWGVFDDHFIERCDDCCDSQDHPIQWDDDAWALILRASGYTVRPTQLCYADGTPIPESEAGSVRGMITGVDPNQLLAAHRIATGQYRARRLDLPLPKAAAAGASADSKIAELCELLDGYAGAQDAASQRS